jgi:hypothetical protein
MRDESVNHPVHHLTLPLIVVRAVIVASVFIILLVAFVALLSIAGVILCGPHLSILWFSGDEVLLWLELGIVQWQDPFKRGLLPPRLALLHLFEVALLFPRSEGNLLSIPCLFILRNYLFLTPIPCVTGFLPALHTTFLLSLLV